MSRKKVYSATCQSMIDAFERRIEDLSSSTEIYGDEDIEELTLEQIKPLIDEEIDALLMDGETDIVEVLDCLQDNQGIHIDADDDDVIEYIQSRLW